MFTFGELIKKHNSNFVLLTNKYHTTVEGKLEERRNLRERRLKT